MRIERWALVMMNFALINSSSALVTITDRPDSNVVNQNYISNRSPLVNTPFVKLPPGAIKPQGWLLKQLELQVGGFHGHLTEISSYLSKENNAWLSSDGKGNNGWEELPYWLRGFSNAGFVLENDRVLKESKIWIEGVLSSSQPDGWFGPSADRDDIWPKMLMCNTLQDYYEFSNDPRVIEVISGFFKYLQNVPEDKFLNGYWQKMRAGDLLYSVYWLYNRTGDKSLLDLAQKVNRRTARWDQDVINWHNVNMAQAFRQPAIYYLLSGNVNHLDAAQRNWTKIYKLFGQVPGGMFGGDEIARPGYTDPRQAIETCGIVEMMLSNEIMLRISGDPAWADRCEDVAFNSLPAAITADFKALRSMTAPNHVVSDSSDKKPELFDSGIYSMIPHGYYCCEHNMGHGWPYFTENLWQATAGNGLAAVLYAPCQVQAKIADGQQVTITEKTNYPFEDTIKFDLEMNEKTQFPLYFRVPGWCTEPQITLNGKKQKVFAKAREYIRIYREWANGDSVNLKLPMPVSVRTWKENNNSVSVDRGPLTYSLLIKETYVRKGGSDKWPEWEIYPQGPWNYGLIINGGNITESFQVKKQKWPTDNMPFTSTAAPLKINAKAKRIPNWRLDNKKLVGLLQQSPVLSDEPLETVTLVPMGAARLRISAFPTIGTGSDAKEWQIQKEPLPQRASACGVDGTVGAIWDGVEPTCSNEKNALRFSWWPEFGSTEWVEYPFENERQVSSVGVYWLDDTGEGRFRVPASWRLLYKDPSGWQEVKNVSGYGTETDKYNFVTFEPVKTRILRLEVQLKSGFSGGVLEVKVK